ncbi:DUF6173 family protein [Pelagimonas varians]|uniref:Uncharacterized protein n=1 Tax=Pelagimonas varians TaxID=696760 RepID=A0A238L227_9RHOB|nr:DUF6173 family protein [Pelagimonas varians]PYG26868.1 hypothetical protein C8N36_11959 [Pelagimonas varians]SMX48920.1 hypothetical protein PEV8663_04014 [Pelagimonas varians]
MTDAIATAAEAHEADAMPRRIDVHTEGSAIPTDDLPEAITKKPVQQKSPAEWAYERLILYIQNFEKQLDNEHEVAMGFAGGDAGILRIEGLGFYDPDIVTFYGTDPTGARTQLIQHVSQLSVILRALPKAAKEENSPPRRIGFHLISELGTK